MLKHRKLVENHPLDGYISSMIRRHLTPTLLEALADTPAVFLQGARQTGKSTLVKSLAEHGHAADYLTLDHAAVLAAAEHDPAGFIDGLEGPIILDEVQRVPALFLAIKQAIDTDRTPGRFLLTGSANALVLPTLADSLVGRIEILTLWPFSQGERAQRHETLIDVLFNNSLTRLKPGKLSWRDLIDRMLAGGYPEASSRTSLARRRAWFDSYITTILQRDVRDMANIERLSELPKLLRMLATRAGTLLNFAELSRSLSIPQTTLKRYMALLEATFLVQLLPAWTTNLSKRLMKSPKIMLSDTGLLGAQLGLDTERLGEDTSLTGRVLENFIMMEIRKQLTWSSVKAEMYHFRSHTQQEVDLLLEDTSGRVVGVEVKAAASVDAKDFHGLKHLSELAGDQFVRGVVLYRGSEIVPFGKHLHAIPIRALWA